MRDSKGDVKTIINNAIINISERIDEEIKLNYQISLQELGINSVKFIGLVVALEKEFQIDFDDENLDINIYDNIDNLYQYIVKKIEE